MQSIRIMALFALSGVLASAQAIPQLSTAEQISISSLEKIKQDAQNSYNQAQQGEMQIAQEFAASHPGFHYNLIAKAIEADVKPTTPLPAKK